MDDAAASLNIGRPIAWMVDPDDQRIIGVTYLFLVTGERVTVWYTETGEPALSFRQVETLPS